VQARTAGEHQIAVAQPPAVQVYLLGGFRVVVGGHGVDDHAWRRKAARQLFKCLLSRPKRRMTRDEVVELFWPDSDAEAASTNLRSTIHAMRRALAPAEETDALGIVFGDRDSVWLRPDVELWVDADEFERTIQQAWRSPDPLPLLEQASALYAGHYLPDDLYEDWATERRDSLRQLWSELQFRLAQEFERRGDQDNAERQLNRLLQADPSDERAAQELMRLLIRHGRRPDALRVYQRLAGSLRRDLDVEPSADTLKLNQQISAGESSTVAPVTQFRCTYPFPASVELVGREVELRQLEGILSRGRSAGQAVLIGAPAGTGKSALVGHLVSTAQAQGVLCLAGGCYEERGAVPLGPFHDALADFLLAQPIDSIRAQLGTGVVDLARVVPELRYQLNLTDEASTDSPQVDRLRVFSAIHNCLRALAERGATVLCLEDLHAADDGTLQLFHFLARQTRRLPLVLIGTYRDDETGPDHPLTQMRLGVARERLADQISLSSFDSGATRRLVESVLGSSASDSLHEALYTSTGGNPLFIEQLLLTLRENGRIQPRQGVWVGTADVGNSTFIMREVISQRLARLDASCRETLGMAAVLGYTFEYDLLLEMQSPKEEPVLLADLDAGIAASVLQEMPSGYAFRHNLLREAVYWDLSAPKRMLLHTQAGATLERRAGERAGDLAAELAHHFVSAGHAAPLRRKALHYSLEAGRRADRISAHREALHHFRSACELIEATGTQVDLERRLDALEGRGRAERELAMWPQAVGTFRRVLGLAEDLNRRTRVRAVLVSALLFNDPLLSLKEIETGESELAMASVIDAETAMARLHLQSLKALIWFLRGRFRAVFELGDQMRKAAHDLGQPLASAWAHSVIAWAHLGRGHTLEACAEYQLALQAAETSGNKIQVAVVRVNLGTQYYLGGRFSLAREHLVGAIALYRECADEPAGLNALHVLARIWLAEGDLVQARVQAEAALTQALEARIRFAADCYDVLATIQDLCAEFEAAEVNFGHAIRIRREAGYVAGVVESLVGLGVIFEQRGNLPRAGEIFSEAVAIADSIDPCPQAVAALRHLAALQVRLGNQLAAAELLSRALRLIRAEGMQETLQYAPTLLVLGEFRVAAGRPTAALKLFERALASAKTVQHQLEARAAVAKVLIQVGKREAAEEHVRELLSLANRLGAPRLTVVAQLVGAQLATSLDHAGAAAR
jgi:DNA-binding SARP family transcriptional activator